MCAGEGGGLLVELDGGELGVALEERRGDGPEAGAELHHAAAVGAGVLERIDQAGDDAPVLEEVLAERVLLGDGEVALGRQDGEAVALVVAQPAVLSAALFAVHRVLGACSAVAGIGTFLLLLLLFLLLLSDVYIVNRIYTS